MRSKTWAITLALLSRLMVGDCLGPPPLHRPAFSAADEERVRDPDGEIDAAYRMREELARQNLLRHRLKSSAGENGISGTEVDYADDETSPRHRYHSNRQPQHARPHHIATDEKPPPEMTRTNFRQQGSPPSSRSALQGGSSSSRNPSTNNGGHHRTRGDREWEEERGRGAGSQARFQPEEMEAERPGEEQLIRTDPYVHIRSGVDSIQPIAAAIAMQENLNSIEEEEEEKEKEKGEGGGEEVANGAGPRPRPPPENVPTSGKTPVQPEAPVQSKVLYVDSAVKDNEVLQQDGRDGLEKEGAVDGKEVQAALLQAKDRGDGESTTLTEVYFLAVVAGCSVAGFMGLVLAGVCYYRLRKKAKATSDVEYPAYGVTGPIKERDSGAPGDRKLAQSAQMYHYQHQKQQMIASERLNSDVNNRGGSDAESEEENEEGDYTVFECPGLATNGDMEVRNPLFSEQTPVTAPSDVPGSQQGRK